MLLLIRQKVKRKTKNHYIGYTDANGRFEQVLHYFGTKQNYILENISIQFYYNNSDIVRTKSSRTTTISSFSIYAKLRLIFNTN